MPSSPKVSKWRQTTGKLHKADTALLNVVPTGAIWDGSSLMASSGKWLAVPWKNIGGVAIFQGDASGKLPMNPPMLQGHGGNVIDLAFSQFDDDLLFTGSEDCTVKGWRIPQEGLTAENQKSVQPLFTLQGHGKKVGLLCPHHSAANVLATGGCDNTVKIWDIESGKAGVTFSDNIGDQMGSLNFNMDGSLMCTTTKDKKLLVLDSRSGDVVAASNAHEGSKTQKSVWAKRRDLIVTCGFNKKQYREIKVWDTRNMAAPATTMEVDQQTGVMLPFMDDDMGMLYCGGKGDGGIKYYDLWEDENPICPLNSFGSTEAAKGLCNVPKRYLDTKQCEVQRFYKMTTKSIVKISFSLPRKTSEVEFQDDVYPPTFSSEPEISAEEFFAGKNANPKQTDMRALFDGTDLKSTSSPAQASPSTPAPAVKKEEASPDTPASPAPSVATPTTESTKPQPPKEEKPGPQESKEDVKPAPAKEVKVEEPKEIPQEPKVVEQPKKEEPAKTLTVTNTLPVGTVNVTGSDAVACQQAIVDFLQIQLDQAKKSLEQLKAKQPIVLSDDEPASPSISLGSPKVEAQSDSDL